MQYKAIFSSVTLGVLGLLALATESQAQQSYDIYCDGYGHCRATPTQYTHNVVGLAFTRDTEPYFYSGQYTSTNPDFNNWQAEQDTMAACNRSAKRAPCTFNRWVANNQCIAVARSARESDGEYLWTIGSDKNCRRAKKHALGVCRQSAEDPASCKTYDTKATYHWF